MSWVTLTSFAPDTPVGLYFLNGVVTDLSWLYGRAGGASVEYTNLIVDEQLTLTGSTGLYNPVGDPTGILLQPYSYNTTSPIYAFGHRGKTDVYPRMAYNANISYQGPGWVYGNGTSPPDTSFYRSGTNNLRLDGFLTLNENSTHNVTGALFEIDGDDLTGSSVMLGNSHRGISTAWDDPGFGFNNYWGVGQAFYAMQPGHAWYQAMNNTDGTLWTGYVGHASVAGQSFDGSQWQFTMEQFPSGGVFFGNSATDPGTNNVKVAQDFSTGGAVFATGLDHFTSGAGTGMNYNAVGGYGSIYVWDYVASVYKSLHIDGHPIILNEWGSGVFIGQNPVDPGVNNLQVQGNILLSITNSAGYIQFGDINHYIKNASDNFSFVTWGGGFYFLNSNGGATVFSLSGGNGSFTGNAGASQVISNGLRVPRQGDASHYRHYESTSDTKSVPANNTQTFTYGFAKSFNLGANLYPYCDVHSNPGTNVANGITVSAIGNTSISITVNNGGQSNGNNTTGNYTWFAEGPE